MQESNIDYLTHTWNPIAMRCTRCSDGCLHCWHLKMCDRLMKNPLIINEFKNAYGGAIPPVLIHNEIDAPAHLRDPAVIGVQFMGDLFHEAVPDYVQIKIISTIMDCSKHIFLLLTKRPKRMEAHTNFYYISTDRNHKNRRIKPPVNIWHGLTICHQQEANEKIPIFLQVPGKKFLSIEPMLGPIDLHDYLWKHFSKRDRAWAMAGDIDAVILGGESGPGARQMHPDWVRSVRDQCAAAGVPFFFKQWGEYCQMDQLADDIAGVRCSEIIKCGRRKAGRLLDGRTHDDLPWLKQEQGALLEEEDSGD